MYLLSLISYLSLIHSYFPVEHVWNPCCAQRYLNFVYRMRFASPRSKNVYKKRQDRHRQNLSLIHICEFHVFQEKTVVETVEDPVAQISLVNAKMINSEYEIGDAVSYTHLVSVRSLM